MSLLKPAIEPDSIGSISQVVAGSAFISDMPNYYFRTTGHYYFAGMHTAILPTIPGVFAIYGVIKAAKNWQLSSGEFAWQVPLMEERRRPFSNYWIDPGPVDIPATSWDTQLR